MSEVTITEINGMGEGTLDSVKYDAQYRSLNHVENWPEEADFAKLKLTNFEYHEDHGHTGLIGGSYDCSYWTMDCEITDFIKVNEDLEEISIGCD